MPRNTIELKSASLTNVFNFLAIAQHYAVNHHTKSAYARNRHGSRCAANSPSAESFCMLGALSAARTFFCGRSVRVCFVNAQNALSRAVDGQRIADFSDHASTKEIDQAFDNAKILTLRT